MKNEIGITNSSGITDGNGTTNGNGITDGNGVNKTGIKKMNGDSFHYSH